MRPDEIEAEISTLRDAIRYDPVARQEALKALTRQRLEWLEARDRAKKSLLAEDLMQRAVATIVLQEMENQLSKSDDEVLETYFDLMRSALRKNSEQ